MSPIGARPSPNGCDSLQTCGDLRLSELAIPSSPIFAAVTISAAFRAVGFSLLREAPLLLWWVFPSFVKHPLPQAHGRLAGRPRATHLIWRLAQLPVNPPWGVLLQLQQEGQRGMKPCQPLRSKPGGDTRPVSRNAISRKVRRTMFFKRKRESMADSEALRGSSSAKLRLPLSTRI